MVEDPPRTYPPEEEEDEDDEDGDDEGAAERYFSIVAFSLSLERKGKEEVGSLQKYYSLKILFGKR